MGKVQPGVYPPFGGAPQEGGCAETGGHGFGWLSGNIRRKLTLFVVVILGMVIGLFWFFSIFMLQPAYTNSIQNDLSATLSTVVAILDTAADDGLELVRMERQANGTVAKRLSQEVLDRLNAALAAGTLVLDNRCLDVADGSLQNILVVDRLDTGCVLHPDYETGLTIQNSIIVSTELNSEYAKATRNAVLRQGTYYKPEEKGQIIMGETAVGGAYSVILSANIERIPQAQQVLQKLLLPLSLLLGLFSVLAAWAFSRWFTGPLSRLSVAAREMAKGNYDVRVADCGSDEIGELARDFNRMAREVKRSAELQRDLIANVSHDLRTPLTLIKGYAETVRDLSGDDPEKRTAQLNVIVDESDRLSALVGSVMELSRMSSGHEKSEPVRFDLSELCDEITFRYDAVCRQNGYTFDYQGEEGCEIVADPDLVERALHNLLGNALSHIGADGYIGLKVFKTAGGDIRTEVMDHGPGIDEKDLPHLFDRYYRARADSGKPGTGLGLSISKAIFLSQGFRYGVESTLGQGSTFWFEAEPAEEEGKGKRHGREKSG